jgi:hypothetical protein
MRLHIRRLLAQLLLSESEQLVREGDNYAEPWIRAWFRSELWEPLVCELLGRYPIGHRYHQRNPIIRYYPIVVTVVFLSVIFRALYLWLAK